ncbi:mitotic checkpoint serine/threonine-protein kinase BUB1-like [Teleopsis dalmanni]|uniref:mitotic checkpoint serine/threonine-protein kinase BUB1-like n=1 Tax=Teleopsis dalmanni TaxID=139649 RepID=UPI0018CEB797|nr:mitotic checkpoint serine/threonine-protein kinase BUB1-like [Teleopsis dalmanni]
MHDFSIGDNRPLQVSTKSQNISNSFFHLNKSETKDSNASSFIKPKSQLQFRNTQNNTHEMQDLSVVLNSQPQKENLKAFSSGGSTLKFLSKPSPKVPTKTNYENSQSNLNFLEKPKTDLNSECKEPQKQTSKNSDLDDFFELNAETALFSTNISLIKNSTLVSNYPQKTTLEQTHEIRRQVTQDCKKSKQSFLKQPSSFVQDTVGNRSNLNATEKSPAEKHRTSTASTNKPATNYENAASALGIGDYFNKEKLNLSNEYDDEMSIYFKNTPRTPKNTVHVWRDSLDKSDNNSFVHRQCDLNQTNQLVERFCVDPNVNPFNVELINAFLDQIDLITFLKDLQTCRMVGCVPCIKPNTTIEINGVHFQISKLIGEGAYGAVYKGIDTKTGDKYALKQERPPNYWEYYICLELQSRITSENMLNAYMKIDFSLIGNNSSVLVSKFSDHGSLINVCNKVKKATMKNVDEYVVMYLTCELLEIMDHLHAANIIHADIKPDNILLMNKLTYPAKQCCLQLIDFGVSIDMQLFKPGQTFSYVHNNNAFNCVEMRDKRPWTYQLDLYGLAGVIHVLLFGKYMEVEKRSDYIWMHKTHVPRYFNKILWETIFRELLNVRDCNSMPNLQQLRAIIKREIIEKEKFVINKIAEFNKALSS